MCALPAMLTLQLCYVVYCGLVLHLTLFSNHCYLLLHCLTLLTLAICAWLAHALYLNEQQTDEWERLEEEMDALIIAAATADRARLSRQAAEHRQGCIV